MKEVIQAHNAGTSIATTTSVRSHGKGHTFNCWTVDSLCSSRENPDSSVIFAFSFRHFHCHWRSFFGNPRAASTGQGTARLKSGSVMATAYHFSSLGPSKIVPPSGFAGQISDSIGACSLADTGKHVNHKARWFLSQPFLNRACFSWSRRWSN